MESFPRPRLRRSEFSLRYFRVLWEPAPCESKHTLELAPRLNRQIRKAVQRNRIKRILRTFFRTHPEFFMQGRWVFIAKPWAAHAFNRAIFQDLSHLLLQTPASRADLKENAC